MEKSCIFTNYSNCNMVNTNRLKNKELSSCKKEDRLALAAAEGKRKCKGLAVNRQITMIDLFAGAGGLSEGFIQAGFSPIAHIEMDKDACDTLRTRCCYHYLRLHNQLDTYYNYLKGKISRDVLYSSVLNKQFINGFWDFLFPIFEVLHDIKENCLQDE